MNKLGQGKCPICNCWFQKERYNRVYCSNECKAEGKARKVHGYYESKKNIVNVLIRTNCYFSYLHSCEGELCITGRESASFNDLYDYESLNDATKNVLATVIENPDKHLVVCRKHHTIIRAFYREHPSQNFDGAFLHVLDHETTKPQID